MPPPSVSLTIDDGYRFTPPGTLDRLAGLCQHYQESNDLDFVNYNFDPRSRMVTVELGGRGPDIYSDRIYHAFIDHIPAGIELRVRYEDVTPAQGEGFYAYNLRPVDLGGRLVDLRGRITFRGGRDSDLPREDQARLARREFLEEISDLPREDQARLALREFAGRPLTPSLLEEAVIALRGVGIPIGYRHIPGSSYGFGQRQTIEVQSTPEDVALVQRLFQELVPVGVDLRVEPVERVPVGRVEAIEDRGVMVRLGRQTFGKVESIKFEVGLAAEPVRRSVWERLLEDEVV